MDKALYYLIYSASLATAKLFSTITDELIRWRFLNSIKVQNLSRKKLKRIARAIEKRNKQNISYLSSFASIF